MYGLAADLLGQGSRAFEQGRGGVVAGSLYRKGQQFSPGTTLTVMPFSIAPEILIMTE